MKTLIVLVVLGGLGYFGLMEYQNEDFRITYCRRYSRENALATFEKGYRQRVDTSEKEIYDLCKTATQGWSVGQIIMDWAKKGETLEYVISQLEEE